MNEIKIKGYQLLEITLKLTLYKQQSTVKLALPKEDIMDLLNLYVTSTYFQYNRTTINTTLQTVADILLGA